MGKEITLGDNYHANVGKCCYGHVQGHDDYYGYNFSSRIEKHFKTLEEAKAWAEEENDTPTKNRKPIQKKKTTKSN